MRESLEEFLDRTGTPSSSSSSSGGLGMFTIDIDATPPCPFQEEHKTQKPVWNEKHKRWFRCAICGFTGVEA